MPAQRFLLFVLMDEGILHVQCESARQARYCGVRRDKVKSGADVNEIAGGDEKLKIFSGARALDSYDSL